ncbi:MAG TPA: isoprenyl transferase [Kiritimatiellia bacterium]|nr:isoprenyl transferase [Kiritimatiellia bacterium]HPJ57770.1 isoprenyl transferase [Kiritimatiellia bacterium]HPR68660.1 isoprenyl transferase [Kiritimatiellia bacterium]HRX06975.1 isoprenyl transferase [Kiritimatiellia bacterium]
MTGAPNTAVCIPRHVAVIMDGNGRWAKQRGQPRLFGHRAGAESLRAVLRACRDHGVEYLTVYAFSTENWVRPKDEVGGLMSLLKTFLKKDEHELHENQVRLRVTGRIEDLPRSVRTELERVMEATKAYTRWHLILALSYGGRTEITDAVRAIARKVKTGELEPEAVDETLISRHLYLPDVPDPDLMIRTSGELRLSNFLLWELSYAEFYFTDTLWPDFREPQFAEALAEYSRRQRRFGAPS